MIWPQEKTGGQTQTWDRQVQLAFWGGGFHTCQTVVGFIVCVLEKFSLCSPGWSDIYYLDQDSFEITDIGLLVSSVLALKVCALYSVQQTA